MKLSKVISVLFVLASMGLLVFLFSISGTDIFPASDTGQVQVRLRLPVGTRLERTEAATQELLAIADSISNHTVDISSAFVGTQPSSYPINTVFLWTSGPNESVTKINLKRNAGIRIEEFKEQVRQHVTADIPGALLSFEPGDLVDQVVNLGTNNPIEIAVMGRNLAQARKIAESLNEKLKSIGFLRDVQIATPLDYPGIKINIDRVKAGQMGLTVDDITKSTVAATSSSRFTQPDYWLDKNTGTAYQVQVEYPQYTMNSVDQLEEIPISSNTKNPVYLRDVATIQTNISPGEYDRMNQQRYITLTANIFKKDVAGALKEVNKAIGSLGTLPQGIKIMVRGQADLLNDTITELRSGLLIALLVIFLLLAIQFQSFALSLVTLAIIPAVLSGSALLLLLTGQTLNIQSYMGAIMAVGVAVANAVLFISNAEFHRKQAANLGYALSGAHDRLRPILMTSFAMIAGMIPMAIGLGQGSDQTAPLGIAVIGGLLFSTISTLIFLPLIYGSVMNKKPYKNRSLDPEDPGSKYYEAVQ